MQLRPYQIDGINSLRSELRAGHKSVVLVAPTGSGKTVVSSEVMRSSVNKNKRVLFLAHRLQLIKQTCEKLCEFDLEHKIYAPDKDVKLIRARQFRKFNKLQAVC